MLVAYFCTYDTIDEVPGFPPILTASAVQWDRTRDRCICTTKLLPTEPHVAGNKIRENPDNLGISVYVVQRECILSLNCDSRLNFNYKLQIYKKMEASLDRKLGFL